MLHLVLFNEGMVQQWNASQEKGLLLFAMFPIFHWKGDQMLWADTVEEKKMAIIPCCTFIYLILFVFFASFLCEPGHVFDNTFLP